MAQHPLQRLKSPSRQFSLLLHAAGILSFSLSFNFLGSFDTPMSVSTGGWYKFLTILGLLLSLITFVAGALADLTLNKSLFTVKNVLASVAAPLEGLIAVLYWSIAIIDKSLLFDGEYQLALLPDVGFHAAPALFLVVDLLLLSPPWTMSLYSATTTAVSLAVGYFFWVEWCYQKGGFYPYPLMDMLLPWQRAILFIFSASLMVGGTMALKWTYGKVNGVESVNSDLHRKEK